MLRERNKFQGYSRYAPDKLKSGNIKELIQLKNVSNKTIVARKNFSTIKSFRIRDNDLIKSGSNSPKTSKSTTLERKSFLKNGILKPITSRAAEYEHAIKTFLGISLKSNDKLLNKQKRLSPQQIVHSPIELKKNKTFDAFDEKLKAIESKELDLKKNLRNLNLRQKVFEENKSFVISPENQIGERKFIVNKANKQQRDGQLRIYKSLQGAKKILRKILKS